MKSLFISLLLFLTTFNSGNSQGLNSELSFNNSYSQTANGLMTVNEHSYFILYESNAGSFFNSCSLIKTDTLGNIVWNVPLNIQFIELTNPLKIIPTADSGILISGDGYPTCDVAMNCFRYLQKYNDSGTLLWSKTWLDENCFGVSVSGLSADSSHIFINYMQQDTSAVLELDHSGNITDSLLVTKKDFIQIMDFGIFEKTAITTDSLFGFDTGGNAIFSRGFGSPVKNFSSLHDTLYLLTSDSIFSFDTSLQLINSSTFFGYGQYSHLKVSANEIHFLSSGTTEEYLFTLNHSLQLTDSILIPEAIYAGTPKDYSDSHFTAAINFALYDYQAIRHLDFSLKSNQNANVNTTDIGVIDIQEIEVSCSPHPFAQGVYDFDIYADVLIKNYGNQTLTDCRINHYITMAICSHVVYSEHFSGLNLAPGDSMWINCGLIHSELEFLSGIDTLRENICIYTSQPNFTTDLNVPNDSYCESIAVGYVGITENEKSEISIYPNPASSILYVETDLSSDYIIYDLSGKSVLNGNLINNRINIESLASGFYFLRLTSTDGSRFDEIPFVKE